MKPEDFNNLLNTKSGLHPTAFFAITFGAIGTILGGLTYADDNTMPVKELGSIPVRPYAIYPHEMLEPDFIKKIR